jgi:hypothetical protein
MQRTSVVEGDLPALIIAPHGADDDYTAEITERIAEKIGAYAVINWGWERAEEFDYDLDAANCNNVSHLMEDVVKQEFLEPIQKYVDRILTNSFDMSFFGAKRSDCYVYIINGMGNHVRKKSSDPLLDVVLGYGGSNIDSRSSYSCDHFREQSLAYLLQKNGLITNHSKKDGDYAANTKNNLNQYWRKWKFNACVQSIQIEIVKEKRKTNKISRRTADTLSIVIEDHIDFQDEIRDRYLDLEGEDLDLVVELDDLNLPPYWDSEWKILSETLGKY